MTDAPRAALRRSLIVAGAIAAALLAALFFPWQILRGPLAAYVGRELNREVAIGALDVDLGRITRVQLDGVTIGNAKWATEQPMAQAERIVLYYSLGGLLAGEPEYVQLIVPTVELERHTDGTGNWDFGTDTTRWPTLAAIDVDRGSVRYRDPALRADIALSLATRAVEGGASALELKGRGELRGEQVVIEGRSGGLVALRRTGDPYPLTIRVRSGRNDMAFDGTIVPGEPENVQGTLRLRGPDLSELYPIVPSPLPWTPPYDLKGELAHSKALWSFRRFSGKVGDSDLAGSFQVDVSTRRPRTTADLTSARFDYDDLGGFIGLPPENPRTAEQQTEAARRAASDRVLPDRKFDLVKLRAYDANVKFRGKSVRFGGTPIDNLASTLKLENGVMEFDPLDFGIGNGHVVSNIRLDLNKSPAQAEGRVEMRAVELKRVFPKLASPQGTAGRLGGRAHFRAEGNSIAAMAATLDGDGALLMRGGEASTLQLLLTNLDLANAAALLLRGDETAHIRCAVTAVHARRGIVEPEMFVVDTSAVVIEGDGTADLRNEALDFRLTASSKRPSLVALRGPIVVQGTFAHPVTRPALVQAGVRVGAAIGLAAVAPPLALLPLIDLGGADDVDCRAVIDEARVRTDTTERLPRASGGASAKVQRAPRAAARASQGNSSAAP